MVRGGRRKYTRKKVCLNWVSNSQIPGHESDTITTDSHRNRILFSLTLVHCFDIGYVGKQPVAWKEYCAKYGLKELQESMDRCTGCRNITELLLQNSVKHFTINQLLSPLNHPITFCVSEVDKFGKYSLQKGN